MNELSRYFLEQEFGLQEVDDIAIQMLPLINDARIITFSGPLGAGKTTLIRSLARLMHVADQVKSPTFAYMATYRTSEGTCIYHFDLYRLRSLEEFRESGFEEYFYLPQSKVFIEWPEVVKSVLPVDTLHIALDYVDDDYTKRKISAVAL
jgi:tRNA threonylcarbamoyladenosine biosynthesis protein TsaE